MLENGQGWLAGTRGGYGERQGGHGCVCVCGLVFNIPLYAAQTGYDSGSAEGGALLFFRLFSRRTSWPTGLTGHSDPHIPTARKKRSRRPRTPKKIQTWAGCSPPSPPTARVLLLDLLPRAGLVPNLFHLHLARRYPGAGRWLISLRCPDRLPPLGGGGPPPRCLAAGRLLLREGMGVSGGESLDGGLPEAATGKDWDCTPKPGGIVSWAPLEAKSKEGIGVGGGGSLGGGLPEAATGSNWDCTPKPGGIDSWPPPEIEVVDAENEWETDSEDEEVNEDYVLDQKLPVRQYAVLSNLKFLAP